MAIPTFWHYPRKVLLSVLTLLTFLLITTDTGFARGPRSEKIGFYDFMPNAAGETGSPFMLSPEAWNSFDATRFDDGGDISKFIQHSVLSPVHADGDPHSVASLIAERRHMMEAFLEEDREVMIQNAVRQLRRKLETSRNLTQYWLARELRETEEVTRAPEALQDIPRVVAQVPLADWEGRITNQQEKLFLGLSRARELMERTHLGMRQELLKKHKIEQTEMDEKHADALVLNDRQEGGEGDRQGVQPEGRRAASAASSSPALSAASSSTLARDGEPSVRQAPSPQGDPSGSGSGEGLVSGLLAPPPPLLVSPPSPRVRPLGVDLLNAQEELDPTTKGALLLLTQEEERVVLWQKQQREGMHFKHAQELEKLFQEQEQRRLLTQYYTKEGEIQKMGGALSPPLQEESAPSSRTNSPKKKTALLRLKPKNTSGARDTSTSQAERDILRANQTEEFNQLITRHERQLTALRKKNTVYKLIFTGVYKEEIWEDLKACTKEIRSNPKGELSSGGAGRLIAIITHLAPKEELSVADGYNLALAILHRKTDWSMIHEKFGSVDANPNANSSSAPPLGGNLKNVQDTKRRIKEKAFRELRKSAAQGFVPAMSLLALIYQKSNYRWGITKVSSLGIASDKEFLGQTRPNPPKAVELSRIAGFLGGDPAALLGLASLSSKGLDGVQIRSRHERLLAEYQYVLAALALTDDTQLFLKKRANDKVTRYAAYVKTLQGLQETQKVIAEVAKTVNDLNTIVASGMGLPIGALKGASLGQTTTTTTMVAPTGTTNTIAVARPY